jgi:hypothetical protein
MPRANADSVALPLVAAVRRLTQPATIVAATITTTIGLIK